MNLLSCVWLKASVSKFTQAAIREYLRFGGLKKHTNLHLSSGGLEVQDQGSSNSMSGEMRACFVVD